MTANKDDAATTAHLCARCIKREHIRCLGGVCQCVCWQRGEDFGKSPARPGTPESLQTNAVDMAEVMAHARRESLREMRKRDAAKIRDLRRKMGR